jgi:hypothetical protein
MADKKELEWAAPEFEYHHKDVGWYWLLVGVSIILLLLALWQRNFLFAVFVLIAALLILKWGHHHPRYLDFRLTNDGLEIDKSKFFPFDHLSGFATRRLDHYEEGLSEIILKKKHRLSTYLKVIAPTAKIEEIRIFLNKYLPEIEYEESLTDHIARILKF